MELGIRFHKNEGTVVMDFRILNKSFGKKKIKWKLKKLVLIIVSLCPSIEGEQGFLTMNLICVLQHNVTTQNIK